MIMVWPLRDNSNASRADFCRSSGYGSVTICLNISDHVKALWACTTDLAGPYSWS